MDLDAEETDSDTGEADLDIEEAGLDVGAGEALLREVKTCIALKNCSGTRYSGPVICTFPFNNFYPIRSLFMTLASCMFLARLLYAYIS